MKVTRFEDLIFWQKARELTQKIYSHSGKGRFRMDFGLRDQVQRASVSIMSNIAEGFGRGSNRELIQFLYIARGSLSEVKSLVYVAQDMEYITKDIADELHGHTEAIARLMNAFLNRVKPSPERGPKHAKP